LNDDSAALDRAPMLAEAEDTGKPLTHLAQETPRESSLLPGYLRWAGPVLAAGYRAGLLVHRSLSRPQESPLPAVCIGNLTVGGTGKTPAVKYFARRLVSRGRKPAVLMRGYKGQAIDEAREMQQALDEFKVPTLINSDRLASAKTAQKNERDIVLLDDGFQHWRLSRDLDIVLIDATQDFAGARFIPHGRLREHPAGLARAKVVIITRADAVRDTALVDLRHLISSYAPQATLAYARHRPLALRRCSVLKEYLGLETLRGTRVLAACGIGNPRGFQKTLLNAGAEIAEFVTFPDHHAYTAQDVSTLQARASALKVAQIIVTAKDAAKLLTINVPQQTPVWSLDIEFEFLEGEDAVWQEMDRALEKADRRCSR
jgi:tetraacyldisaccharide 4'-kinase